MSNLGRGPTSARTTLTDEFAVTLAGDTLTKAERQLVEQGDDETVRSIRRKFQVAMTRDITRLVEEVTGRKAKSLLSDHDVRADLANEMVIFEAWARPQV